MSFYMEFYIPTSAHVGIDYPDWDNAMPVTSSFTTQDNKDNL